MKAAVRERFGSPEAVVEIREIEKPVPADDEVLVRVRAASLNMADWYDVTGRPYVGRVQMGLRKPKSERLGVDYAGTVEAVGKDVTQFRPGDDVFGGRNGAYAEYVCAREDRAIVPKPADVSFEEAAAVPVAALTALQGLRDRGQLEPGQKVLINGASGGVGTYAVQIAKALGGEVTAVCSTGNVEIARSLGADHVIDYTREDFTRSDRRYDLMLDVAGSRSWSACKRVLNPTGDGRPGRGAEEESPARTDRTRRHVPVGRDRQRSEARLLHREVQQARHGDSARAARERKDAVGGGQAIRVERDRGRARVHRRRARQEERSSSRCEAALDAPRESTLTHAGVRSPTKPRGTTDAYRRSGAAGLLSGASI